ncbi:hypothetical protein, partial [Paenibacillus amylolyticus]|uniref:hypothetical protein n=1 Tax=Paenibacillus amylolyticus TaxID=1451 RepID=UPI00339B9353
MRIVAVPWSFSFSCKTKMVVGDLTGRQVLYRGRMLGCISGADVSSTLTITGSSSPASCAGTGDSHSPGTK